MGVWVIMGALARREDRPGPGGAACWFAALVLFLALGVVREAQALPYSEVRVQIRGVEGAVLENVEAALELPPGLVRDGRVNELWLRRFERGIPKRVETALQPFGYYEPRIQVERLPENRRLLLRVSIQPGVPVRVVGRRLRMEGDPPQRLRRRLNEFPLAPGEVLRHDLYENAKAQLKSLAVDLGYLDAEFSLAVIRVNREQRTAEIEMVFDPGPRYHFGEVTLTGNHRYPEKFLRRHLAFSAGEVFSFDKLGQTQQNFFDSDRFSGVMINPRIEEAQNHLVPIEIDLEPSAPRRLRPGIGFGTDTGARFTLNFQDVNVVQTGHELGLSGMLAERQKQANVRYILPSHRNMRSMVALRAGYQEEDLKTYDTRFYFAEVERIYGWSRNRQGTIFLRLQQEDSNIGGEDISSRLVMPGVRYSQMRFNDPIRPTRGYHLQAEVRGTHDNLGSDVKLLQFLGNLNFLIPLPFDTFLHLRGQGSTTNQSDEIGEIPASLRFFTGGDRSVRGYGYQTLGPTDDLGNVIGGKHLLAGSIELEKRFADSNWALAAFYDTGNAFDSFTDFRLARAAGGGVRYYTPVGPIKVDVARQIDEPTPSFRLHIGIGLGW
ncbi:autotransporter secretion outer membrane protein TamA [Geoalkalibacter ferrihydriticus]|uniref:Translocation and assembly module subunit TamA n=1 Tax=Geoalkalibacter ferrihydriticus TaxID=392333 RepID=A0A1G9VPP8_9BACT|nr:autotransporter assembly complex family protein [Geoalkalibacter ferrihydriticus]SDM73941.1 autotransporter secretion outer membrane protein TamA [Geoalkalibacter ferrihydriticus]